MVKAYARRRAPAVSYSTNFRYDRMHAANSDPDHNRSAARIRPCCFATQFRAILQSHEIQRKILEF